MFRLFYNQRGVCWIPYLHAGYQISVLQWEADLFQRPLIATTKRGPICLPESPNHAQSLLSEPCWLKGCCDCVKYPYCETRIVTPLTEGHYYHQPLTINNCVDSCIMHVCWYISPFVNRHDRSWPLAFGLGSWHWYLTLCSWSLIAHSS